MSLTRLNAIVLVAAVALAVLTPLTADAQRIPHYSGRGYCSCAMCRSIHYNRMRAQRAREMAYTTVVTPAVTPDPQIQPTPDAAVELMISLARIQPDDVVLDPGCGDARLLIAAVNAGAARGVGFEIDAKQAELARQNVIRANLGDRIRIWRGDCRELPWPKAATVALVYLFSDLIREIEPQLQQIPTVISYAHPVSNSQLIALDTHRFYVSRQGRLDRGTEAPIARGLK